MVLVRDAGGSGDEWGADVRGPMSCKACDHYPVMQGCILHVRPLLHSRGVMVLAMSSIRVDAVPLLLRPLIGLYGYAGAAALALYFLAQRPMLRLVVDGGTRLSADANYIFCLWHDSVSLGFQVSVPRLPRSLRGAPHAWMQHPLWYMKPIHLLLRIIGVRKIVLGSSGHGGRSAADALVELLRAGYSTIILPDGPAGPRRELKKGVLHIACQSGVPIVPLRLSASRCYHAPTWDRKVQALPFSVVRLSIGRPMTVSDMTLAEAARTLAAALG